MLILVFTLKTQVPKQKSMIMLNYTTLMATNDFKNRPVFTDLQKQACKTFIALPTGLAQAAICSGSARSRGSGLCITWRGLCRTTCRYHYKAAVGGFYTQMMMIK